MKPMGVRVDRLQSGTFKSPAVESVEACEYRFGDSIPLADRGYVRTDADGHYVVDLGGFKRRPRNGDFIAVEPVGRDEEAQRFARVIPRQVFLGQFEKIEA